MTARKPRESAPLPFRLLRLAYEEARANALENVGGLSTLRDEWARSLRGVVAYDRGQRAKATRGRKAAVARPPHDVLLETARELGARLCGLKVAHAGRTMILEIAPEGWRAFAEVDEPIEYTEEGSPIAWVKGAGPTPAEALDACAAAADRFEEGEA